MADEISSPFRNPHGKTIGPSDGQADLCDRNPCEYFDKLRESGPTAVPEVNEAAVAGRRYHLNIDESAAKISSPMNSDAKRNK